MAARAYAHGGDGATAAGDVPVALWPGQDKGRDGDGLELT